MKAAIYIRVSTEEQAQHGFSLNEQREACHNKAVSLGAVIIREYADEGISGATLERPGLTALREAVQQKEVEVVIIRDPDRLSRRLSHQLLLTEELENAGTRLEFIDFDWKDTPDGRLFYAIRGAIAEYEKEKIRERMMRGKLQKARQGGIPMGFYNYGYIYDPETGQVKVHRDEAAVVKDIFKWFTEEDLGLNGLAKRLNAKGILSRHHKKWHRQVIKQILQNTVYKGSWKYKDIFIPVPAIVEDTLWEAAQEKLKVVRQLWAGSGPNRYLLSGLMTCGNCGNSLTGLYTHWWGQKERRYSCRKKHPGAANPGCIPGKSFRAEELERTVWAQVVSWLQFPEVLLNEVLHSFSSPGNLNEELTRVEKYLRGIEKGRQALIEALGAGFLDLDTLTQEKLINLRKRKEALEQRKKELLNQTRLTGNNLSRREYYQQLSQEVLVALDTLDFAEKRAIVRALIIQIKVFSLIEQSQARDRELRIILIVRMPEPKNNNNFSR
ncbi:MAG: recombinase family protein [Syntrophomonadaceae bacterium]|nr:recombinase family protein [Syntrophomonadaceae bacterium]